MKIRKLFSKQNIFDFIPVAFSAVILFLVFERWFLPGVLSNGDWPYLYPKAVSEIVPFSSWDSIFSSTIGQSTLPKLWSDSYALTLVKLAIVFTWPIFERVVWFFPYVLISFFASFFLSKKVFDQRNFNLLSGLIYSANTYSLLIVSGGQAGVMIAYAFLPIAFLTLLNLFEFLTFRKSLIFSLSLAVLIILDLRVGYMFLAAEFLLVLINLITTRTKLAQKILYFFIIPGIISFLINLFWILPIILVGKNPSSEFSDIYTSSASLAFFSFAKFEDAISLFHPNWPDNFFGKTSFLPAEVLIIPILAFASLIFIEGKEKSKSILVISFVLLGLIGAFLAKGVNEPFGQIYTIFFDKVPGFVMFRDATKWYMLIAISNSILIPYGLVKIGRKFSSTKKVLSIKYYVLSIIPIFFIFLWAFLMKDAILGNVKGTLHARQIPNDYQRFATLMESDKNYSRTLWVPTYDTFSYNSETHPYVPATDFFAATSSSDLIRILKSPNESEVLQNLSIKYVVIPFDTSGRIFVTDRKYDAQVYEKTIKEVGSIKYLKEIPGFGNIKVFEVKGPKGHFWSNDSSTTIDSKFITPYKYNLNIKNAKKDERVIFAEGYDGEWTAKAGEYSVSSIQYPVSKKIILNSFVLPADGSYNMEIYYKPQDYVNMGLMISGISIFIVGIILLKRYELKR